MGDDLHPWSIHNAHTGTAHGIKVLWFVEYVETIGCIKNAVSGSEHNLGIDKGAGAKAPRAEGRVIL
jgi:hypothetical protein